MAISDDEPFGNDGELAGALVQAVGGQLASQGVRANALNQFKIRVRTWAERRSFVLADSQIVGAIDGVEVKTALYELTPETAVVRGTSRGAPVKASVSVEPKTWKHRITELFGAAAATGDDAFDRSWHVASSDRAVARALVDEGCRDALRTIATYGWCRASYDSGRLEVRIDVAALSGKHLLAAMEVLAAFGRAEVRATAYR